MQPWLLYLKTSATENILIVWRRNAAVQNYFDLLEMKFTHLIYAFGMLLCLPSCSEDEYAPYEPTEWQYDQYSDSEILPGDDFYRFACGKGIAAKGADSWTPLYRWMEQENDFSTLAFSDGNDNPVPVLKRLNELKVESLSEERMSVAFARMRDRLNGIENRAGNKDFPEKAAEYCRNGYPLFLVKPMLLDGHRFGLCTTAVFAGMVQDLTEQQLDMAGIKDKYNHLLPKARMFEKYLWDHIKDEGESIDDLDAGIPEECRKMKRYLESYRSTRSSSDDAFSGFASALGSRNPDFVPSDSITRQYFGLVDKMDTEMKEAADAFLWCAAVSYDMDLIQHADRQVNFFMATLYPNLLMSISHTFCDMYAKPENGTRNKEIFESLRRTMAERIDKSEWMTPYTKAGAQKKIDTMECHNGILDWSRYEADMPVSDDYCSAMHEVGRSYISKLIAYSGENHDLDHIIATFYMTPMTGSPAYSANSFYLQNANVMCILPSTSLLMDMNPDFPFLTFVIGHEMCHGFDANGANFNERGELCDWWSIDDRLVFKNKQDQLIGIFNQYFVGGTTFCNGTKTITEDMADLGGLEIAYYTTARELEKRYRDDELKEMKRRFFKSYAVLYAQYSSLEEKIKQVENDVHSIYEFRINGIVNHIDDWYRLYDVTPERKLYLSPERRVHFW